MKLRGEIYIVQLGDQERFCRKETFELGLEGWLRN